MGRTKNNAEKAKMLGYKKTLQQLKVMESKVSLSFYGKT